MSTADQREDSSASALADAVKTIRQRLLQQMHPDGFWSGRLSSSALSTATAISALSLARNADDAARIASGIGWLVANQNNDGGWGDTAESPSNLATTLLAVAALTLADSTCKETERVVNDFRANALKKAQGYLSLRSANSPATIVTAIEHEYGEDRTFAVPILMNCALADLVAWDSIPGLPFEMAALPHAWFKALRLHVVSYALPALIAIGLLIDRRHPPTNVGRRLIRKLVTRRVLDKLRSIQPDHGGFLEATPLTSFVGMALLPLFGPDDVVGAKCLGFLRQSQRTDGAWPIDTNLSVWLTTASVTALAAAGELPSIDRNRTARWIAAAQNTVHHPYTHAKPGGWPWTQLPGGVPDVDDTSGAILALSALGHSDGVAAGVRWLLELQNSDGGWPTFCRGWGKLPFDKSAPDLTAHALRAISTATHNADDRASHSAIRRGLQYLADTQQPDGSWIPLWFGNQASLGHTNPVLGTARVLRALDVLDHDGPHADRAVQYLLDAQNADGGWGGARSVASSIEETALAVASLASWTQTPAVRQSFLLGTEYLVCQIAQPNVQPAPIGLYFAHLWYSEELYPLIWAFDALTQAMKVAASAIPPR